MSRAAKVLLIYYIFLAVSSLILSLLGIHSHYFEYAGQKTEFNPMWIPTIIGGMIALKLTIPPRSFKLFVIIYCSLWVLRFIMLYVGNKLGEVNVMGRPYRFDLIIYNYYKNVSRLDTHLPFVLYWFINYLFTIVTKNAEKEEDVSATQNKEEEQKSAQ